MMTERSGSPATGRLRCYTFATMKTMMRLLPILLAAALQQGGLSAAPAQQAALEPGWTALFNGKDFTDWKVSGNKDTFKIVDGALAANAHDPNSTVSYTNIRIKPLDDQAPAPAAPAPGGRGGQRPQAPIFTSPEVAADRRVTFRLDAPDATSVSIRAGDIPAAAREVAQFTKQENGVWEATTGALEPGAYRYVYVVNGVSVIDPRNTAISESNTTAWSVVAVPGSEMFDTKNVPHGAVASVYYQSTALGRTRRMHVYTPPGYETSTRKYPVFYLLHGAGDCDDSWTSVGRANFILDNLIAANKAKPMIVVMPAGHTSTAPTGRGLRE